MIYLNNAATSYPKPDTVINAVTSYIKSIPFHSSRGGCETDIDPILFCRQKLAKLFNVTNSNNIIFTSGSTEALNLAIRGLESNGKHIITTAIEHNSVLRPLKVLEEDGIIELSIIPCDKTGYVKTEDIAKEIKENTIAIIVSHCSNVTGTLLDIKSISKIAHSNNAIIIVDASQSVGCIDIDVIEEDIDVLAFTGHKSLYGIPGTGGLYIREGIKLKPLKVGGTGAKSETLYQPKERPTYYESGTPNSPGIISMSAGIDFIFNIGLNEIKKKKIALTVKIANELEKLSQIIVYGNNTKNRSPVFAFNIEGYLSSEVSLILENTYGIIVRSGLHCAPLIHKALGTYPTGLVRISPSYFNTFEEIDICINAIKEICNTKSKK